MILNASVSKLIIIGEIRNQKHHTGKVVQSCPTPALDFPKIDVSDKEITRKENLSTVHKRVNRISKER